MDLNENMTSEEIAAYAESLVSQIQEERYGEKMTDASIITDTTSVDETTVDDDSNSVVDDKSDSISGEKSASQKWLTDKVKAEASAYGLDDTDLAEFSSREELDRALRLLGKTAFQEGQKAVVEDKDQVDRNEKGQFVKKEETTEKEKSYKVLLDKDRYDDEIVNEFERMRDYYESRLQSLESSLQAISTKAEELEFDSYVDALGHPELFGKTGKETEEELGRRKELLVAVKAQIIGLERLGRPVKFSDQLVNRVANMVFADELNKKRLKQQTQKVFKMSNLRQGGSPVKPLPPSDDPREEAERLYRELERS
jgi:hypothetical protein